MLNDTYYEQIVDRKKSASDKVLFVLFLVVLFAFLMLGYLFLGLVAYILVGLLVVLFAFLLSGIPIAWEYSLTNYMLRIDAVYKRRNRKEMMEFDIRACDVVAPQNSPVLNGVKPDRFYLYHNGIKEDVPYAIIFTDEDGKNCVILNLDETMRTGMKRWLGTKVH